MSQGAGLRWSEPRKLLRGRRRDEDGGGKSAANTKDMNCGRRWYGLLLRAVVREHLEFSEDNILGRHHEEALDSY